MSNILIISKNEEEQKKFKFLEDRSHDIKNLLGINTKIDTSTDFLKILDTNKENFQKAEVIIISDIKVYTNFLRRSNVLSNVYFPNLKEMIFSPLNESMFNLLLDHLPYDFYSSKYNIKLDEYLLFSKIKKDSKGKYKILSNINVKLKGNVTFFLSNTIQDNEIYLNRVFSKNKFLSFYKKFEYLLPSGKTINKTVITPINNFEKSSSNLLKTSIINFLNNIK